MAEKTDRFREFILAVNSGRAFVTVADVERFKQESMYGLSAGAKKRKKKGHCREVAVSGGSTVVKYLEKNLDIKTTKGQGNGKIC